MLCRKESHEPRERTKSVCKVWATMRLAHQFSEDENVDNFFIECSMWILRKYIGKNILFFVRWDHLSVSYYLNIWENPYSEKRCERGKCEDALQMQCYGKAFTSDNLSWLLDLNFQTPELGCNTFKPIVIIALNQIKQ